MLMKVFSALLLFAVLAAPKLLFAQSAPDFTVTTSDGEVKQLYQDYIDQQKVVVVEAFFTTCPPCAAHAPGFQSLYTSLQAAHPGQVEFMLLSTLITDTNQKVADYKVTRGLTMPGVGNNGGSIAALQPYMSGTFGPFQGTPTFFVIAPGTGQVFFDIRGNNPGHTMQLIETLVESFFPKDCPVTDPFGNPLEEVQISVNAAAFDTTFEANGSYNLSEVAALKNTPYTLTAAKSGDPLPGLTTYDLVLISKHILSIEPFLCPWQMIAADINCSGSITSFDIVTARKVILGIVDTLPCGTYRFMPDSVVTSNGNCQPLVGVKIGDVNAQICDEELNGAADDRAIPQKLHLHDRLLQPGETASIPLFLPEHCEIEGLQFALDFDSDKLSINKIDPGTLQGFDAESWHLSGEQLRCAWVQPQWQGVLAGTPLLYLDVLAPHGGKLSELLRFSENTLRPELYSSTGIRSLQLEFLTASTAAYSVSPNPSSGRFTLCSKTGNGADLWVQLLDIQGKIVLEKTFQTQKGTCCLDLETPAHAAGLHFLRVNGEVVGKLVVQPR